MNYISENIVNYISSIYGEELTKSYQELCNQQSSQFIRINQLKISAERLCLILKEKYSIDCEKVSNYSNIFKIEDKDNIIGKILEHILGYYYIQSFSSFIPPLVLNPSENDVVLDLCAAPGSKTTELGEIMRNRGTIVANEIQLARLKSLVHNIDRMNQMNSGVLHSKGEQLNTIYANYFDKILVDAPCSGLGIIQKKNEVSDWWTLESVGRLSELQLRLLVSAIKMLKIGGEIVYSTCTLTVEENEMIIDKILKKYPIEVCELEIEIPYKTGIVFFNNQHFNPAIEKGKRILPWEVESDGFFIIKLRKTNETKQAYKKDLQLRDIRLLEFDNKHIKSYLIKTQDEFGIKENQLSQFKYIIKNNNIFFVDRNWHDENPGLFERIGTRFGIIDKENKVVLNTLAAQVLSNSISNNIFEIKNSEDLKKFLEGRIIKTSFANKGQCIVKYEDYTLGTGVFTDIGLKSQFPRAFRTQEILL